MDTLQKKKNNDHWLLIFQISFLDNIKTSGQRWADHSQKVGSTSAGQGRLNFQLSGSPMSAQHWATIGLMLEQPSANVDWGDVGATFRQHLPTFGRYFVNKLVKLCLLIFVCDVLQDKPNFWCLKYVQKISYFKACFCKWLEAWHSHVIIRTSG